MRITVPRSDGEEKGLDRNITSYVSVVALSESPSTYDEKTSQVWVDLVGGELGGGVEGRSEIVVGVDPDRQ